MMHGLRQRITRTDWNGGHLASVAKVEVNHAFNYSFAAQDTLKFRTWCCMRSSFHILEKRNTVGMHIALLNAGRIAVVFETNSSTLDEILPAFVKLRY